MRCLNPPGTPVPSIRRGACSPSPYSYHVLCWDAIRVLIGIATQPPLPTTAQVEAVPVGIGNCTGMQTLLLERNFSMKMPPKDIVAKGYPATWEFLRKLAHAERSKHLELKEMRMLDLSFLDVCVGSTYLGKNALASHYFSILRVEPRS